MNGITIVGSYNVGLFLKGSKLPDIGETVIADEFLESGANLRLSNQDLDRFDEVFHNSAIVGFQLENDRELVRYGLRKVHDMGIPTFLDPAPAVRLADEMLRCVDYLKPNETEAGILTGIAVKDVESARDAARWLLDRGVGAAIVTLGAGGVVLATGTEVEHFPAPQVASVDSTGAGDVFSGDFLAGFAEGLPIAQSIKYGTCAAALSATRIGVIEPIPSRAETIKFMDARAAGGMVVPIVRFSMNQILTSTVIRA